MKSRVKKTATIIILSLIAISLLTQVYGIVKLPQSKVAVAMSDKASFTELQESDIKALVTEAVNLAGGISSVVQNGDTVILKPNLVIMNIRTGPIPAEMNGITTDWRVTKAVSELVRAVNPSGTIYIMEGSAYPTAEIMEHMGYVPANFPAVDDILPIDEVSGGWQETSSPLLSQVSLPNGLLHTSYYLNKIYKEADVLISIPTLKNHGSAGITGSIKNVGIGCPPANIYGTSAADPLRTGMANHMNDDLHKWIHDFFMCRPVDFVVTDGLVGFQNGPGTVNTASLAPNQMNMRLILAGKDPVSVDTIQSLVIGWDPQSINHLVYLNNDSMGNIDTSCITVAGKKVADVRKDFAGYTPTAGGSKITDKTAPSFSIGSYSFDNNVLNVSITAAAETTKIELYIDDLLVEPPVTSSFTNFSYTLSNISQGNHTASAFAYDRFLNQSVSTFTFTSQGGSTPAPTPLATADPTPAATIDPTAAPTASAGILGDVNGNGSVDIVDALLVAQFYVGLNPSGFIAQNADVNCSSTVDIIDALLIAQYYVGLITEFC